LTTDHRNRINRY